MQRLRWTTGALAGLVLACGGAEDGLAPGGVRAPVAAASVPESELHFLQPASGAPPLAATSVSFYAVRGQDREASLWYHRRPGAPDSSRLVRLRVDRRSLVNAPDGTPLAPGDSVLITLTVVDPARLIVEYQPAGLVFAPRRPAKVTYWYLEADHDFNGDGVVDALDRALERSFGVWGQEQPGDPWNSVPVIRQPLVDQIEGSIPGFTRYAVAY